MRDAKGPGADPNLKKQSAYDQVKPSNTEAEPRNLFTSEALPVGTVLTVKSGQDGKLGSLWTRDDQGILYKGTGHVGQVLGWAGLS